MRKAACCNSNAARYDSKRARACLFCDIFLTKGSSNRRAACCNSNAAIQMLHATIQRLHAAIQMLHATIQRHLTSKFQASTCMFFVTFSDQGFVEPKACVVQHVHSQAAIGGIFEGLRGKAAPSSRERIVLASSSSSFARSSVVMWREEEPEAL